MNEGWICPICDKGLAPWVSECPCVALSTKSTDEFFIAGTTRTTICPECGSFHEFGMPCQSCGVYNLTV